MADDPNPTPADSGPLAPAPAAAPGDPATAEILAVVVPGTDGSGGVTTPPAGPPSPAPPRSAATRTTSASAPAGGVAATGPAATGPAATGPAATGPAATGPAATGPAATGPAATGPGGGLSSLAADVPGTKATPLAAASNDTPTITRPAPRPKPPVTPRPAPARPVTPPPTATTPIPSPTAAPARPQADWAAEIADRIDDVVAKVRANTSDRLVGIARMVVYGLLAAVLGLTALVLLIILFFRVLAVIPGPVWIPYLVLGAIFVGGGRLLFARAKRTPKPHSA